MLDTFLYDYNSKQLGFVLLAALVAGLARGFSGFGAALIFVPLASAAIGPKLAVPVLLVADALTALVMLPSAWRLADRKAVGVMSIGALVGVPLGAYVLTQANPLVLRWAIVVLVAGLLALIVSGWRYHGRIAAPVTVAVGAVSGVFSGAAQVGGPPVVVYWLGGATQHREVRANIVLYFQVSTVISMVSYLAGGLITLDVLMLAVVTAPVFGLAMQVGSHLFGRANEAAFRRICYALIALAAIAGLPLWDSLRA